ncbi:hypothetical protein BCR39DRAFT_562651, partial [Naematelia encephala]
MAQLARSPMLTPRASSPQPRASTSSSRSALRTGADFEAALLDPGSTIFLSGSPRLGEPEIRLVEIPVHTPDAPLPVEKRSFESDLRGLAISTPVKGLASPGVIPPTPSPSSGQKKLSSHATMDSIESTTSIRRVKLGPALGIDAELHEVSPVKGLQSHKRRSIFRSPGTASSPDLATLVRRAKEAKGIKPHEEEGNALNGHNTPVAGPSRSSTSHSVQTQASSRVSRERAVSDWDTESSADLKSLPSGDRVASMSEGRRSRQSSAETEGHKSVRSKAKGMLGRMFGTKDPTPTSSPSSSSCPPSTYHPPVPPVPATYAAEARRKATHSQPSDSSRSTLSSLPSLALRLQTDDLCYPCKSAASAASILSVEKPLPAQPNDLPPLPLPRRSNSRKGSMHIRQPAGDTIMEHDWEPPRTQGSSFSDDVAGMLDKIGQSEPAQELGLAPETLRRTRSKSSDSARRRDKTPEPSPGAISPVLTQRTSSLQHISTPALAAPLPQRTTPSPHGDSQVSRTSSTSSR